MSRQTGTYQKLRGTCCLCLQCGCDKNGNVGQFL